MTDANTITNTSLPTSATAAGTRLDIAALGSSEFTLGFELVGVRTIIPTSGLSAEERIETVFSALQRNDIGILIIEEESLAGMPAYERVTIENALRPVVVILRKGVSDSGTLRRQIMRAIGVDLYEERH